MLNTVIVVDDSENDRYLVRRILGKAGTSRQVLEFPDALSALGLLTDRAAFEQQCGPWPPRAVLLLDVNMPRVSGFEFLQLLEQNIEDGKVRNSSLAVVMYSSSDCQADVDRALSHAFVIDYVVKPLSVELAARIAQAAESLDGGT